MRICKMSLLVVLLSSLVACADDDDAVDAAVSVDSGDGPDADEAPDASEANIDAGPDASPDSPDAAPDATAAVSFSADIVPLLQTRCGGCHLKDVGGAGGLSLGVLAGLAYEALVDQQTVKVECAQMKRIDASKPDDPMQSSLYVKLVGTTCGKQMPTGMNAVLLNEAELALFAGWIAAGAPNN
jgi:hypothetical protein